MTDGGQLLVSPEYLRHLTKLANEKMELNWARIERFHALFKQRFLAGEPAALHSGSHGIGQRGKTCCHMVSSNSTERQSERFFAAVVDAEAAEAAAGEVYLCDTGRQCSESVTTQQPQKSLIAAHPAYALDNPPTLTFVMRADEDVKTGVALQRLLALRSRQCAILAQLQELRLLVSDQPDHAVSGGPFWRLAPLHAHVSASSTHPYN